MKLGSVRNLEEQREVLMEPYSSGPDPVYWVFSELTESDTWANLTVIAAGNYEGEFPKTYGHYHPVDAVDETYHLIEGEGILMMQRKKMVNGEWIKDEVEEVCLIQAKPGDEVVIKPAWGHSWSNVGKYPLLSFDNWRSGHTGADYAEIKQNKGMAYYLVEENGEVKAVANPNYKNLPEPKWVSAREFKEKYS